MISREKNKGRVEEIFSFGRLGKKKSGEWVLRAVGGVRVYGFFLGSKRGMN